MRKEIDSSGGFMLAESMLSVGVLSIALIALMPPFMLTLKANKAIEQTKLATELSSALIEEIGIRRWDELTPIPAIAIVKGSVTLGVDSGENAADKKTFNDIDDFNGWIEKSPSDPMNNPIAELANYTRTVTVRYVDAAFVVSPTATDLKQVTVCTQTPKGVSVCLDSLFANR